MTMLMPADERARVANGFVAVSDWVRELPAQHFQPCYCCLCKPEGGERPIMRVDGIVQRDGATFLRLPEQGEVPAEELERVEPPARASERTDSARSRPMLDSTLRTFVKDALR